LRLGHYVRLLTQSARERLRLAEVLSSVRSQGALQLLEQPLAGLGTDELRTCLLKLREFRDQGAGVVLTTHDPMVVSNSDYVIELSNFRMVKFFGESSQFALDQFLILGSVSPPKR
jgi:excinuclease UvrABC ATPase subunit